MDCRDAIQALVGERLSAVCFVSDYIEICFGHAILRSLTKPSLSTGRVTLSSGQAGFRDLLCSLIGARVEFVEIQEDVAIVVSFGPARLTIPLDRGTIRDGEAAHFVSGPNEPLIVW